MAIHLHHPIIPLAVGALLVSLVGASIFGVWAVFDVIPSTRDNSFVPTQCVVASSAITSYESCPCADDGITCSDTYPCMQITVNLTSNTQLMLYQDLRGQTFSTKCSYYPLGRMCTGNSTITKLIALRFMKTKGRVGKNYTCYVDKINKPTVVVATRNLKDVTNLVLFIMSVVLFFVPTLALNVFFLYKWQFLAYLSSAIARHHRVGVPPPIELDHAERRSSTYRIKTLQFAEANPTIPEEDNKPVG